MERSAIRDGLIRVADNPDYASLHPGYEFDCEHDISFSRLNEPELCIVVPPEREQGMPGACCTRGLVCNVHEEVRTRAYRYSRSTPAFPAQWVDGLCRALPGDEFVLPPSLPA